VQALKYEPCSPTCANWLRYGIQPKNARPGLLPGFCKGKAHRREHLGYGGRRVLVSRKWSGKTLADHKAERRAYRYLWQPISSDDPDIEPLSRRLLRAVAERVRWRAALDQAQQRADGNSATTGRAA
jgi:hypothetical protein